MWHETFKNNLCTWLVLSVYNSHVGRQQKTLKEGFLYKKEEEAAVRLTSPQPWVKRTCSTSFSQLFCKGWALISFWRNFSTSLPISPNLVRRGSSELSKFRSHSDLFGRNTKSVLWLDPVRSPPALRAAVPSMSAPLFPRLPSLLPFLSLSIYLPWSWQRRLDSRVIALFPLATERCWRHLASVSQSPPRPQLFSHSRQAADLFRSFSAAWCSLWLEHLQD